MPFTFDIITTVANPIAESVLDKLQHHSPISTDIRLRTFKNANASNFGFKKDSSFFFINSNVNMFESIFVENKKTIEKIQKIFNNCETCVINMNKWTNKETQLLNVKLI